ncbi:uncharacterized protein LOC126828564 [Patella vulgata]|uniref:uncharacterized protein LOC126828564 n=1 Tax=Patella vulgata TaxID=6465 RepID=UPI00217FF3F1|nr:uncharacterized protein LOC126828564 [Patella vulgata]
MELSEEEDNNTRRNENNDEENDSLQTSTRKSRRQKRQRQYFTPDDESQSKRANLLNKKKAISGNRNRFINKRKLKPVWSCGVCRSPYVSDPRKRKKVSKNKQSRHNPCPKVHLDSFSNKYIEICNACDLILNPVKKPDPAPPLLKPEDKTRMLHEAKDFATNLADELNDRDAERLFCGHFKSITICGCLQTYLNEVPDNRVEKAKEFLQFMKEARRLSKQKFYKKDPQKKIFVGLGNGQKKSREFENYIFEKRQYIRQDLKLCETACKQILLYSNNFLHKNIKTEMRRRMTRTKCKGKLNILPNIDTLHQRTCCFYNCVNMAQSHSYLLYEWRSRAQTCQAEARRVLAEMLTPSGGYRCNCNRFIHWITGCSSGTIQRVNRQMRETRGNREPPQHGLRKNWEACNTTTDRDLDTGSQSTDIIENTVLTEDALPVVSNITTLIPFTPQQQSLQQQLLQKQHPSTVQQQYQSRIQQQHQSTIQQQYQSTVQQQHQSTIQQQHLSTIQQLHQSTLQQHHQPTVQQHQSMIQQPHQFTLQQQHPSTIHHQSTIQQQHQSTVQHLHQQQHPTEEKHQQTMPTDAQHHQSTEHQYEQQQHFAVQHQPAVEKQQTQPSTVQQQYAVTKQQLPTVEHPVTSQNMAVTNLQLVLDQVSQLQQAVQNVSIDSTNEAATSHNIPASPSSYQQVLTNDQLLGCNMINPNMDLSEENRSLLSNILKLDNYNTQLLQGNSEIIKASSNNIQRTVQPENQHQRVENTTVKHLSWNSQEQPSPESSPPNQFVNISPLVKAKRSSRPRIQKMSTRTKGRPVKEKKTILKSILNSDASASPPYKSTITNSSSASMKNPSSQLGVFLASQEAPINSYGNNMMTPSTSPMKTSNFNMQKTSPASSVPHSIISPTYPEQSISTITSTVLAEAKYLSNQLKNKTVSSTAPRLHINMAQHSRTSTTNPHQRITSSNIQTKKKNLNNKISLSAYPQVPVTSSATLASHSMVTSQLNSENTGEASYKHVSAPKETPKTLETCQFQVSNGNQQIKGTQKEAQIVQFQDSSPNVVGVSQPILDPQRTTSAFQFPVGSQIQSIVGQLPPVLPNTPIQGFVGEDGILNFITPFTTVPIEPQPCTIVSSNTSYGGRSYPNLAPKPPPPPPRAVQILPIQQYQNLQQNPPNFSEQQTYILSSTPAGQLMPYTSPLQSDSQQGQTIIYQLPQSFQTITVQPEVTGLGNVDQNIYGNIQQLPQQMAVSNQDQNVMEIPQHVSLAGSINDSKNVIIHSTPISYPQSTTTYSLTTMQPQSVSSTPPPTPLSYACRGNQRVTYTKTDESRRTQWKEDVTAAQSCASASQELITDSIVGKSKTIRVTTHRNRNPLSKEGMRFMENGKSQSSSNVSTKTIASVDSGTKPLKKANVLRSTKTSAKASYSDSSEHPAALSVQGSVADKSNKSTKTNKSRRIKNNATLVFHNSDPVSIAAAAPGPVTTKHVTRSTRKQYLTGNKISPVNSPVTVPPVKMSVEQPLKIRHKSGNRLQASSAPTVSYAGETSRSRSGSITPTVSSGQINQPTNQFSANSLLSFPVLLSSPDNDQVISFINSDPDLSSMRSRNCSGEITLDPNFTSLSANDLLQMLSSQQDSNMKS